MAIARKVVDNDAKMVPPVNAENSRSGGACTRNFVSAGATFLKSFSNR